MHQQHSLPVEAIKVENRQRLDYGDLDELVSSIQQHGLIQPIIVNLENRLIAGGRRLSAIRLLGWSHVPVVFRETLSVEELHILELEENVRRKDETWQEQCLHIATIHQLKTQLAAKDLASWGMRETGAMLGVGHAHVGRLISVARELKKELDENNHPKEGARFWACEHLAAAIRLQIRDREDEGLALLAKVHQAANPTDIEAEQFLLSEFEAASASEDLLAAERDRYYSNPHNPPGSFEEYWAEKTAKAESIKNSIYLSHRFHKGDSIKFMEENEGRFDHIITDIPYGIDMAMLNQQNPHGEFKDIDTVEELHDVKYNLQLIADFFPAAYKTTKDKAFVITWCDQMLWQYMYDHATKAGFQVQRWPITWVKTSSCMNQCVAYNTTKDTEIAMVCRKKGATLARQPATSVISTGKDDLCSDVGHPFAKPHLIWEFLANLCSLEGQSILEPFAGRGSGVISLLRCNRNVFGVELDEAHFNALIENTKSLFYLKLNPNATFK